MFIYLQMHIATELISICIEEMLNKLILMLDKQDLLQTMM